MRVTTILARVLGLKQTRVQGFEIAEDGLVIDVAPTTRVPICSGCCKRVHAVHDTYEGRRWRHLDVAGMRLWLRYTIRRPRCPRCGVTVELVPWAAPQSWFTYGFEQHVAYLAQRADKTTLSDMLRIGWATVGSIIERVVARLRPGDVLDGLRCIGVDELSYRRHHEYVTVAERRRCFSCSTWFRVRSRYTRWYSTNFPDRGSSTRVRRKNPPSLRPQIPGRRVLAGHLVLPPGHPFLCSLGGTHRGRLASRRMYPNLPVGRKGGPSLSGTPHGAPSRSGTRSNAPRAASA